MTDLFAEIGVDGWVSPDDPPDDGRIVQVAWDDKSFGPSSLAFRDTAAGFEDGARCWWGVSPISQLPAGHVYAWRDVHGVGAKK